MNRRALLIGGAGALAACATARAPQADVVVAKEHGVGDVQTVAEALARANAAGGRRFTISVAPGRYYEKLTIDAPNVSIVGAGARSIIEYDAAAGRTRPDGSPWGTSGSATITVNAPGAVLRNFTVRNSFDYLDNIRTGATPGAQAVALAVGRAADRTHIEACSVEGYQDTLLLQARSYLKQCRISGCVDFVFGGAAAYIDGCEIVSRAVPGALSGYIAAPSTHQDQQHGLVFAHCNLTREPGVLDHSIYLGRPWRAGGNMELLGASAFLHCRMDAHIASDGWSQMGFRDPNGEQRQLTPQEARLFEYGSTGPGAGAARATRRTLTQSEAAAITPEAVLSGWMPTLENSET